MVTGGFQPRFGGHRLYVQMARHLCSNNITVFRFDYEGMGDSGGGMVGFRNAGPSIRSAIDHLRSTLPNISVVIIWSLCDGCPVSVIYGNGNEHMINGLILCNPFVFFEKGSRELAKFKYYYPKRIFSKQFWTRLFLLKVNVTKEIATLFYSIKEVVVNRYKSFASKNGKNGLSLEGQVVNGIIKIAKPIYIIYSPKDLGAIEFTNILRRKEQIKNKIASGSIVFEEIGEADHTFTEPYMKERLFQLTLKAVKQIKNTDTLSFTDNHS